MALVAMGEIWNGEIIMQVIICGGREYQFTDADYAFLDDMHAKHQFTEVVHGDAPGADRCADMWARSRKIMPRPFVADWNRLGRHEAGAQKIPAQHPPKPC